MKKNILLYILLSFLIIVNGFFLYNYMGKPGINKEKGNKDPMSFIIKQLKFDDSQLETLENINKEHRQNMRRIDFNRKELKDLLYSKIFDTSNSKKVIDSLTKLIGQKETELETEVFYHFKSIHELCNDTQKNKFKEIINNALRNDNERNRRPPPFNEGERNSPPPNRNDHGILPPQH
ncbi:hypothetical protein APS56_05835 [Pseudalgibacter alginicilyticus]|uniref:Periplasmic heavy metal sensor n=1 Tax=Pseudalgibacter alginicilyticus TaxID=1736674 RepID=A0A0P0CW57_9FLAO|nr:hypothetical protein [Pseudalgibacter alginicilyticus]ALJ04682.1 hypothetical protein APS56_05835 [Pseudalgibacter alginicilyticus]